MPTATPPLHSKHLSSSILLWMRSDQPRETSMGYWKGPHSKIINASPGQAEYRQIHLAEDNPGRWPVTDRVETEIPADRKIDGVAEVTFRSLFSPVLGLKQTKMAFADEINVFRRTLLYAGMPGSSRWYDVGDDSQLGARSLIYLRRRDGVGNRQFREFVSNELVPAFASSPAVVGELRSQNFMRWNQRTWNTPNVAHDNPVDQQFHASLVVGFTDTDARSGFFAGPEAAGLSEMIAPFASAIHAYDIAATLTYKSDGVALPSYRSS